MKQPKVPQSPCIGFFYTLRLALHKMDAFDAWITVGWRLYVPLSARITGHR